MSAQSSDKDSVDNDSSLKCLTLTLCLEGKQGIKYKAGAISCQEIFFTALMLMHGEYSFREFVTFSVRGPIRLLIDKMIKTWHQNTSSEIIH